MRWDAESFNMEPGAHVLKVQGALMVALFFKKNLNISFVFFVWQPTSFKHLSVFSRTSCFCVRVGSGPTDPSVLTGKNTVAFLCVYSSIAL